jgi:hypothetical protein
VNNSFFQEIAYLSFMNRSTCILFLCLSFVLGACLNDEKNYYFAYTGLDLEGARTTNGYPEMTTVPTSVDLFGLKLNLFPVEGENEEDHDYNEGTLVNTNPIIGMKVWSNAVYDTVQPGGNLNAYFWHFKGNYFNVDSITQVGAIYPRADLYPNYGDQPYPSYTYLIARTPPAPGNYRFFVRLILKDSTTFVDSTDMQLVP